MMLGLVLLVAVFAIDPEPKCPDVGSKLLCENCKCFGASKHTHLNITERQKCAKAAHEAGMKYYSWLRFGKELLCSFGTHIETIKTGANKGDKKVIGTEEDTCDVTGRDTKTVRPWRLYEIDDNTDNCKCETVEETLVHDGYKCDGFERIRKWIPANRRTAKSAKHCGLLAYQSGHEYFSYRNTGVPNPGDPDERWCVFGHMTSSEAACNVNQTLAKDSRWGVYKTVCNERHYAVLQGTCGNPQIYGTGMNNEVPPSTTVVGYTACCNTDDQAPNDQKCFLTEPGNPQMCIGVTPVDYYTARSTCEAHNLQLCEDILDLARCCQFNPLNTCGFSGKYYWTSKLSNPFDVDALN